MKQIRIYLYVTAATCLLWQGAAMAWPISDPTLTLTTVKDLVSNETIETISQGNQELQDAKQEIVEMKNSAQQQLKKYTALKDSMFGESNVSAGLASLGLEFKDPREAMSDSTLKKLTKDLTLPASAQELAQFTDAELDRIQENQLKMLEEEATKTLAKAWMTQTEASTKSQSLTDFGKELENAKTQMDVVTLMARIGAENANDLNSRSIMTSGDIISSSMAILKDIKI